MYNNPVLEIIKEIVNVHVWTVGSIWCVFQDVLLVCEFLISLFTIISVEQWRSSIGCFCPRIVGRKCVNDENLRKICRDNVNCAKCMCNDLKVMCNLLVTALIIALLLIVSGNVELNPGPIKKCSKCEKKRCQLFCDHLLCYRCTCTCTCMLQFAIHFVCAGPMVHVHVCSTFGFKHTVFEVLQGPKLSI